jgi:hypothetical protein
MIETFWWKYNRIPTDDELMREYAASTDVDAVLENKDIVRYLISNGVPVDGTVVITPKQVRWIDTLCAANDSRTFAMKLKESNVTMAQHNTWMKNPIFQSALQSRLERILPDERVRVHSALAREASAGNVPAVKLYLQLTGELTEGQASEKAETAKLMQGILEILETHVDRATLLALADDFDHLLVHGLPPRHNTRTPVAAVVPSKIPLGLEVNVIDVDL